jgi:hypothetical protein
MCVATLALGSCPRQGFARVQARRGPWVCKKMWEWTLTLPNELPFWELESRWTPKTLGSDCKGQKPLPWGILYIIGNLLKCRYPKWAHMTHLDICNTSYGQKKADSQIGSSTFDHEKLGIDPIPLRASGVQYDVRKLSTRVITLVQTLSQSKVCTRSYSPAKLRDSQPWQFRDSHLGVPGQKKPFGCHSRGVVQNILYGGRWWLPSSSGRGESCESEVAHGSS